MGMLGETILQLSLLFDLYAGAAADVLTTTEVVFLLAAFLWDVVFSGDLVNGDARRVRRPARVLLYMSYALVASAVTLYFASGHTLGTLKMEDAFGPEAQAAISVFLVGIAYATGGR
ncbi:MAG: hypothetical protein M3071_11910 [Actinomycetota bacterium]|nr:hypothetical protein [Actinomycetota bacterium]